MTFADRRDRSSKVGLNIICRTKRRAIIAAICMIGSAGCSTGDAHCSFLDDGYKTLSIGKHWQDLQELDLNLVDQPIISTIQKCWSIKPYKGPQHSLLLRDARIQSERRYYLIFDVYGVTDVEIVFLVDKDRGIMNAFQRSTF